MISVVIPVLNESETIGKVVSFVRRHPHVSDVLVVDDGSIDRTPELARDAGARVVTSTLLGKGASMEDGMWAARNDVLLYLDGDLSEICPDFVDRMTKPLIADEADFVKAKFSRQAGRVTTLTAKPLLRLFFPELARLEQPLAGMIAARRSLLRRFKFETDYGVDIGLLLDAAAVGAKIVEVDIGHIEHDSHPLEVLGDMAMQVVRTMLDRAARYHRLEVSHIQEVQEIERQMQAEIALILEKIGKVQRLALLDMDGVLLNGRFILTLAQRCNRQADLTEFLDHPGMNPDERTRKIAELFSGISKEVFEDAARDVPLMPDAAQTVIAMRRAGYRVGIVTDSYYIAAEIVRRRVFADFSIAHLMKFRRGKATGQIMLSPAMRHPEGCSEHEHCKLNVMLHLIDKMGISLQQVLAIGNGSNDICLLRGAGTSVAFRPESDSVRAAAGYCVEQHMSDLRALLDRLAPVPSSEVTFQHLAGIDRDVEVIRHLIGHSLVLAPRID